MRRGTAPSQQRRLGPWARAAFAVGALWLACMLSSLVLRQGLAAAWDEVEMHSLLQGAREGLSLPLGLGQDTLGLRALAALLWLPGFRPGWLHALPLLGILLEGTLLWRLTRRLGGDEAAACAAVALHFGSRLTWMRGATTLGYSLAPLWALSAWTLSLDAKGRSGGLVAGAVSGLLLGEYEACLAALPGLAWVCWRRRKEDGAGWAFAAGLGLSLGALALLLPDGYFAHYAQVRGHSLAAQGLPWWRELGQNLATFFLGAGKPLQDGGQGAAFAFLGSLLALNGLRRLPGEAWLFLAGGLLLLAAPAPAQTEAHRAAVAWGPLCAAAGLGLPRAGRQPRALIFAALAALVLWDAQRFSAQREALAPQRYEYSWRLERAARRLRGEAVASELNFRSMGAFRLRHRGPSSFERADWALLSGEQTGPRPDPGLGAWHPIQEEPGTGTLWLLKLRAEAREDWALRQRFTAGLLLELRDKGWMEQLDYLRPQLALPGLSVFQRSLILDRVLWAAKDVGMPLDLARACAKEPWLSARQCLALAVCLEGEDRGLALSLVDRALALDAQRPGARRLRAELLRPGR